MGSRSTLRHLWFTASKESIGQQQSTRSSPIFCWSPATCCTCLCGNFPPSQRFAKRSEWSSWSRAYADQAAPSDPAACFGMKLNLDSRLHLITLGDFNFHLHKTSLNSSTVLLATQVCSLAADGLNQGWPERNRTRPAEHQTQRSIQYFIPGQP